jgi:hypothetical protein
LPGRALAQAVQHVVAARVNRHLDHMAVFLDRTDDLRGERAVAQHALDLAELPLDLRAQRRADVEVAAGQFEAHRRGRPI